MDKNSFDLRSDDFQAELCRDAQSFESTGDFDLPDYLPEVRKLLRTDCRVVPAGSIVGANSAELGGNVVYDLLYTDPDGRLCSVSLNTDYRLSLPIPKNDGGSITLFDRVSVESMSVRPVGPRRISVRTKLKCNFTPLCSLPEHRPPSGDNVEKVTADCRALRRIRSALSEFSLSDSCRLDRMTEGEPRVLCCRAELQLESAVAARDSVTCRGSIWCSILVSDGGLPLTVTRRIPFEESTDCPGAAEGMSARGEGWVVEAKATPTQSATGGWELLIDITAAAVAEAAANVEYKLVTDAFMPGKATKCRHRRLALSRLEGVGMGNFSVGGRCAFGEALEGVTAVVDTSGRVRSFRVSVERGRPVIGGEIALSLIVATQPKEPDGKGGYASFEYDMPFRCELDTHTTVDEGAYIDCEVRLLSAKSRIDSSDFVTDTELWVGLIARSNSELSMVEELEESEAADNEPFDGIAVYYPENGDSLWSIAKHYGMPVAELAGLNGLPRSSVEAPDLTHSIDGYACLLIVK